MLVVKYAAAASLKFEEIKTAIVKLPGVDNFLVVGPSEASVHRI